MPGLLNPRAREMAAAYAALTDPDFRPPPDQVVRLEKRPSDRALAAYGLRAVGRLAVPVETLERLATALREAPRKGGAVLLGGESNSPSGGDTTYQPPPLRDGDSEYLNEVLRGLGYTPAARHKPGEPQAWRRRRDKPEAPAAAKPAQPSPFAALAALKAEPRLQRRRRRKPRRKAAS
jgi:ATP-dependent RNA helicase SUPV3L1/SUV3